MKILIATLSDMLPSLLDKVLSPEVKFSAVVVDNVESAKKLLPSKKILPSNIFPSLLSSPIIAFIIVFIAVQAS